MLAIDTGFSSCKVKIGTTEFKFPSAVAVYKPSAIKLDETVQTYDFEGQTYVVGEAALEYEDKKFTRDMNFILKYAPLFVTHALEKAKVIDYQISVGLPLGYFKDMRDAFKERLKEFTINKVTQQFNVKVSAQGIGILADYISTQCPSRDESGYILDIGSNTVIVLRYQDLKAKAEGSDQYDKMGISKALEDLRTIIEIKYGRSLDNSELNQALLAGTIKAGYGQRHDISGDIKQVIENYVDTLVKKIEDTYDKRLQTSDRLILAGGGAYYLEKYMPEKYKGFMFVAPQPEFSNVRGYYLLGNM